MSDQLRPTRIGRFHVITDEVLQDRYSHGDIARLALAGGADAIQFREKRPLSTRELVASAESVARACQEARGLCIVDDRSDVAFAVQAEGVHLGRDDLPIRVARALLGSSVVIGGTANSVEEAQQVVATPIDYLGVGPVFGTQSKANPAPPMGLETLSRIAALSPVPVIAIGNITPETVEAVLSVGAFGIAVLSGVTCSPDPMAAAEAYAEVIGRCVEREERAAQ